MSCEIPLLLFAPVPSEGQKGALGRKPWLSAEVQRQQRERAALEDFDLRRAQGQSASEQHRGHSPLQHPSLPRRRAPGASSSNSSNSSGTSSRTALWLVCPEAVLKDPHRTMALY